MNGSTKILPTHLNRQAVVYLRQSDPKQVRHNRESAVNQRALQERLRELGWKKEQISVIDGDQGVSAKHAAGRESFQQLVADVGLGKMGIIMGFEVSRLARNCADWHRLLELCALFDTLIGDSDGIYHPRDFNDRLLLGLKGTMSEAELHSLRLRLDAGRLSKAKRGELEQHLPTGLIRGDDGRVIFDPDKCVQERIRLIHHKFIELGTVGKVLRYLVRNNLKLPRRQRSGPYVGEIVWKEPSSSALYSILKNPAYAGAFAYGRRQAEPTKQIPGRPCSGRLHRHRSAWLALVPNAYPAFISWEEYEQIQQKIEENHQRMTEKLARKRAVRGGPALLAGLVRCSKCGHTMSVSYKGKSTRFQYKCDSAHNKYGKPSCQFLSGYRIDDAVVAEFFRVLEPAQIDALERVSEKQTQHQHQRETHLEQEVMRLEYQAARAERQYNCVDPENRLIAGTLEKKWESALVELEQARAQLAEAQKTRPCVPNITEELRASFADVGRQLPKLWPMLAPEAKKSLLRTLVERVNLFRDADGVAQIRIVWRGGQVTETRIRVPVHSLRYSDAEKHVAERIRQLTSEGKTIGEIATALNGEGLVPCRGGAFTKQIVLAFKKRFRIVSNLEQLRRGNVPFAYTPAELADLLEVHRSWVYRMIGDGSIQITKDPTYGCYLFPRTKQCVGQLNRLKKGAVAHVSFSKGHKSG
jgi:DNA invertase Pin-like site-specific DNA recombinase